MELCHNGNGNIEAAVAVDTNGICVPDSSINLIYYPPDTPIEFQKPLGTGVNLWPASPQTYSWSLACTKLDPVGAWLQIPANRDQFSHVSHTFTHEALNNATSSDARLQIAFNQAWMSQTGIANGKFSPHGLVPPAITGLHNGDVISQWMSLGINMVVGDNTRAPLLNTVGPILKSLTRNASAN